MASNADIEMRWVDVWNKRSELIGNRRNVVCQRPDSSVVDVEACKAWLQKSAYEGDTMQLKQGRVGHQEGIVVSRTLIQH